jgi:outer membrane murein-binding lipoprotein Lpp
MLRLIAVLIGIACLAGCSSAPVQEMSDARQAIAAARLAGATEVASPELYAAQAAITRAEKHIDAQEYTRARLAAMEAKHHAGVALASAQHAEAQRDAHLDGQHAAPHGDSTPVQ